ncbi:DEAD/DEAH box helicase [Zavarzinia sp. CC-PAN008]|uniref:DEAD/DEAH box helicase n=1 Tax=Zavarzinia sp. CC-PAN008 TaxID=3243332 RepID=UPI003F744483
MPFSDLGLGPALLQAVADAGYSEPTPIQAKAIPQVLAGRDILGVAQTGTGKTASFTLPMIEILAAGRPKARMPRSLILEPTRELAAQVAESFDKYGKNHKLTCALLIGGVSFGDQEKKLDRGVDVLIATPGRLLDHMERGRVMLNGVQVLVVDEADRMLDMGFIPDVEKICKMTPAQRQTLFFSATMAPEIKRLTDAFLNQPVEVTVARAATTASTVTQGLVIVEAREKRQALRNLLRNEEVRNAIIFCNRKRDVDVLHKSLTAHGFSAAGLHGDMAQAVRTDTLERFKKGEITLLVASDVAARGLDVTDMSHVFNFDVPIHPEDYVHRIGRTGRAGKEGRAFTLAVPDDARYVAAIEKIIGKEIPKVEVPGIEAANLESGDEAPRRGRGRKAAPKADKPAKGEADDAPARPRRSSRSRTEVRDEAPPRMAEERAVEEAPERPAERAPARHAEPRGRRPDDRRRRRDDDDAMDDVPLIGFGDNAPAFMLQPIRAARS